MKTMILAPVCALMLCGCFTAEPAGHLYPVQGPLTNQTPMPIYNLHINGSYETQGVIYSWGPGAGISATLDDGEVCQGKLEAVNPDDPMARNMEAEWDRVYGKGFFVANVLGVAHERATLTGNKGSHIVMELYDRTLAARITTIAGVARDDHGDLFKLTF